MAKRITLPQLKKYDVTQKVIEMLADAESRAIIFSIIRKGKTAAELSEKQVPGHESCRTWPTCNQHLSLGWKTGKGSPCLVVFRNRTRGWKHAPVDSTAHVGKTRIRLHSPDHGSCRISETIHQPEYSQEQSTT